MNLASERNTVSLVVRMWREPSSPDGSLPWRGQIEHVESGEVSYFQLPQGLIDFLTTVVETNTAETNTAETNRNGLEPEGDFLSGTTDE